MIKILLTNDDGIYAPGLLALYKELKKIGRVSVVAPDSQRSSVGHGISLSKSICLRKITTAHGVRGTGVSGTPADCVKIALKEVLKKKPDIVVSGINLGPNDGYSVFYSGTVAAAREGSLNNIPSIAFSLDTFVKPDFACAARFAGKLVDHVRRKGLPKETFLSVNVPNLPEHKIKGVKITRQGKSPILTGFMKVKNLNGRDSYQMTGHPPTEEKDSQIDTVALGKGYITITPIHNDLTNYKALHQLKAWNL